MPEPRDPHLADVTTNPLPSEWKYILVRRLMLFLEESLTRDTRWVVFEPNDEPLWAKIRVNVEAFMMELFHQHAFQGETPKQAFFVKCDHETTTPIDQELGLVNILVGFAPLKPAEFVTIRIQQRTVNPYKTFKFLIRWDKRIVAGFNIMHPLKKTTEVVEHRTGGDPSSTHKSPGRTEYDPITLERGVTHDLDFEDWVNKVWNPGTKLIGKAPLPDLRKDLFIDLLNEAGQTAITYKVRHCWVSEIQSLPDLDTNANTITIQHIKIENEGWEQHTSQIPPINPPA